ncbi:GNAT family N-acetyltransferase [Snodgrassella sp. CFCC 13594]|uniref:GNAT family N-acetyltransferase n=1 Tax=Snodgrassella sp. CFCC 13594 TaxID=1775559 RepID=UPI00082D8EF7|nr:GNAT family protein [Snodgrassella sp. CFCC 13594]
MQRGVPIHLETNGFLVRSLTPADASVRLVQWFQSPQMTKGLNIPNIKFDLEKLAQFIADFDNLTKYLVGIFDKKNNLLIGFYSLDVNLVHRTGNITAAITESDYEGRKIFWLTIDAFLDHIFLYTVIEKVTARVLSCNRRMLFNFINNPRFVLEARLYQECVALTGGRVDVLLFVTFKNQNLLKFAGKSMLNA